MGTIIQMQDQLTYVNREGKTVYTSLYLSNRGTCCRTKCLHCPYGHTLKTCGLQFSPVNLENLELAKEITGSDSDDKFDVTQMLLAQAYGKKTKKVKITEENLDEFRFILLKEVICGVAFLKGSEVSEIFLKDFFNQQGISLELVNSYFS